MAKNLLVLTGRRGSGKDYLTKCLIETGVDGFREIKRLSFSDMLRHIAHDLFHWCPLDPSPEEKDVVIDHPDNVLGLTPREVWLRLADNNEPSLRKVDPKVIVNRFAKEYRDEIIGSSEVLYVITDLRTPDEDYWLLYTFAYPHYRIRIKDAVGKAYNNGSNADNFEDDTDRFIVNHEHHHDRTPHSIRTFCEHVDVVMNQ